MLTKRQELGTVAQWIVDRSKGLYESSYIQGPSPSGGPLHIFFVVQGGDPTHEVQLLLEDVDKTPIGLNYEKNKMVIKLLDYWKGNEQVTEQLGSLVPISYEPPLESSQE